MKFHQNEKDVIGKCPKCGNDILENSKSYYCSDYKNCNFSLWKEQKIFGGFKISKSQATKLINKDKVPFKKLKGNKGEFGANLIIDLSNEKYTNLKIEDFIETKKQKEGNKMETKIDFIKKLEELEEEVEENEFSDEEADEIKETSLFEGENNGTRD